MPKTEFRAKLHTIYRIPGFSEFIEKTFLGKPLPQEWLEVLANIKSNDQILEIGAGDGRLTEKLAKTGARITAVEPHPPFFNDLKKRFKDRPRVKPTRLSFPTLPKARYNLIVMYQNVFLELANQLPINKILFTLKRHLAPGGTVVFDHLQNFSLPTKKYHPIFHGNIKGLGRVHYDYLGGIGAGNNFRVELFFRVVGSQSIAQPIILKFTMPTINQLKMQAHKLTGHLDVKHMDGYTFFRGQPVLIKMHFN